MGLRVDPLMSEIIDNFQEEGNLTTGALVDMTGKSRVTVTKRLDKLRTADCIEYVDKSTGLHRLVSDPRLDNPDRDSVRIGIMIDDSQLGSKVAQHAEVTTDELHGTKFEKTESLTQTIAAHGETAAKRWAMEVEHTQEDSNE